VTSRPLKGEPPTVDLVVGYHKANTSPILRTFLSRIDDLITRNQSRLGISKLEIDRFAAMKSADRDSKACLYREVPECLLSRRC
jgi:hypothetical protein